MDLLLIDAPGGPQPEELARIMAAFRPARIISVPWGPAEARARRMAALSTLGPVEMAGRPDQIVEAGLAAAAVHGCRAVVALSEIVSFYAGLLASILGLPGNPPAALLALRRKDHQRRLLGEAAVPSTATRTVITAADLVSCESLRFPVILKPSTGVGSLCVFRAADLRELTGAYAEAVVRYRADPRPNGAAPVFVVEEEIRGDDWHRDPRIGAQVSVESLVHEGVICHLGVTDKLPLADTFREVGHISPSLLTAADIRRVEAVTASAITALGLTTGAVHTELMLTVDGPVVIEVNGRLGGGVHELMKFSRGYDVVRAIADIACGRRPALPGAATRYAAFVKPQPPAGAFRVTGIDKDAFERAMILAEWGVLDKSEGAVIDSGSGTNTNLARFIVTADALGQLFKKIEVVRTAVYHCVRTEAIG